ncbi:MAG TPA: hypothetical protein VM367_14050 [Pseudonocardia sp.]|nr:hypothetical protein [Pseudonocardia sp.]
MDGSGWLIVVLVIVMVAVIALLAARSRREPDASGGATATEPRHPEPEPESPTAPAPVDHGTTDVPAEPATAPPAGGSRSPEPSAADEEYGSVPPGAGTAGARRGDNVPALASLDGSAGGGSGPAVGSGAAAVVAAASTREGPYPGSVLPTADGSAPSEEYTIKANNGSRKYHTPESPYFHRNRADVWFGSAADAEAAGFVAWNGRPAAS